MTRLVYTATTLSVATLITFAGLPVLAHAAEVSGVHVAEQASVNSQPLVLNGAGLRRKFVFDVYVAALYVTTRTQDAATLINGPEPRRLQLTLKRDIDSATLTESLNEGLAANNTPESLATLQDAFEQFKAIMNQGGEGKAGDTITLDFTSDGVTVSFKGNTLGTVADSRFGPALMKVWLGKNPAQKSLKQALLGQGT